jgi:hypothetical protein
MNKHQVNLQLKPTMASYFPSLTREDVTNEVYMFIKDIQLNIMPIGGISKQEKFSIKFQGRRSDCDKAKKLVRQLGEFDKYEESEMSCDAVDNVVKNIVWDGQAYYEIVKDKKQTYLNSFTSRNLFKIFNWYIQIIPPKDRGLWKRKYSIINKKDVWKIKIPKKLGGKKKYKKIIKNLGNYDGFGPKFYTQNMKNGVFDTSFNFLDYRRKSKIYVNLSTKNWGWNRRDWSQDNCTEFYTFYRMLNFKYAQALLRESIIEEINCLLKRLSINCKLIMKGIPTSKKILKIRKKMVLGQISFNEVSDKVRI